MKSEEGQLSVVGRLIDGLLNRRTGFFVAELVLVIAGVLIALAVDGWISDSRDRQTETVYLELLARDVEELRQQAELQMAFEKDRVDVAARAYAALSTADPSTRRAELGPAIALLVGRRTLTLSSSTYDQMVSSGHLQLIRNYELRDEIVRYFAAMDRVERIVDNNNRELVDDVFIPFAMRMGITAVETPDVTGDLDSLSRGNEIFDESLGSNYSLPEDRVLLNSPDADSWNDIRRNVLFRMRIAAIGQAFAEEVLNASDHIAAAIATELNGR